MHADSVFLQQHATADRAASGVQRLPVAGVAGGVGMSLHSCRTRRSCFQLAGSRALSTASRYWSRKTRAHPRATRPGSAGVERVLALGRLGAHGVIVTRQRTVRPAARGRSVRVARKAADRATDDYPRTKRRHHPAVGPGRRRRSRPPGVGPRSRGNGPGTRRRAGGSGGPSVVRTKPIRSSPRTAPDSSLVWARARSTAASAGTRLAPQRLARGREADSAAGPVEDNLPSLEVERAPGFRYYRRWDETATGTALRKQNISTSDRGEKDK